MDPADKHRLTNDVQIVEDINAVADCCAACQSEPDCVAFTHDSKESRCYLSASEGRRSGASVSGLVLFG